MSPLQFDADPLRTLTRVPIVETRNLAYDAMIATDQDGRRTLLVGEYAQLKWRLRLADLFTSWRSEAAAQLAARVGELETRWFG